MAGMTWAGGIISGEPYRRIAKALPEIIQREMADLGADGVLEGQKVIDTNGTNRSWNGIFKGRAGSSSARVDTGAMRNAVSFKLTRNGASAGVRVGWVNDYEDYFGIQDDGFSAGGFRPAQFVRGVGMLNHLQFYMERRADEALDNIVKEMLDGI